MKKMKKTIVILLLATLLSGCGMLGYEKVKDNRVQTVHIIDVGNFAVDGKLEYYKSGRIKFSDKLGRVINTHISKCVIVDATNVQPVPPQENTKPSSKPKETKSPPKQIKK